MAQLVRETVLALASRTERAERRTGILTLQVEARRIAVFQLLGERHEAGGTVGIEGQRLAIIGVEIAVHAVRGSAAYHPGLRFVERERAALEIA